MHAQPPRASLRTVSPIDLFLFFPPSRVCSSVLFGSKSAPSKNINCPDTLSVTNAVIFWIYASYSGDFRFWYRRLFIGFNTSPAVLKKPCWNIFRVGTSRNVRHRSISPRSEITADLPRPFPWPLILGRNSNHVFYFFESLIIIVNWHGLLHVIYMFFLSFAKTRL